jgi:hypothetical protein
MGGGVSIRLHGEGRIRSMKLGSLLKIMRRGSVSGLLGRESISGL